VSELVFGERTVHFQVDEELYSLEAIYSACHLFIERCYVRLQRPGERCVEVHLKARAEANRDELHALAGEFHNELLNQVLRERLGRANTALREAYMAKLFPSTSKRATIAELLAELDEEELAEEDLEIAVPWEDDGSDGS
jgi:His-Xaa-Ser system protein HxsD